jgi:WD40 repeat protein
MTDVFISYSRKDKIFVERLCRALTAQQREAWVDWEGIPYSAEWWEEIRAGIEATESFIFIVTPDSLASQVCHQEVAYARRLNKRIIPVIRRPVDDTALAAGWDGQAWADQARENWGGLRQINWLFFRRKPECECEYSDGNEVINPACDGPECDRDEFGPALDALVETVETDLEHVKTHTRLIVRATHWQDNQRNSSFLLRGDDLEEAEAWLTAAVNRQPAPTDLHAEYIAASRREERKRQRYVLTGVTTALAVTLVLAVMSLLLFRRSENNLSVANTRGTSVAHQASTATVAQGQSEFSAKTAMAEADRRATQQRLAEENEATAIAAVATSERRADETQSLLWANSARQALADGDPLRALALAVTANRIANPPPLAQRTLADVAYTSAIRLQLVGHTASVSSVAYSPDGKTALTGAWDDTLALWDLSTGEIIRRFEGHANHVSSVAFSPDGAHVASGDWDGVVIVWDVTTGREIRRLEGHVEEVESVAFSPDGRELLTGADDYTAILWDVDTGEALHHLRGHDHFVSAVAFSPDGQTVATGSYDGTVVLWEAETGTLLRRITVSGEYGVTGVAFSPDERTLLTGSSDPLVILWDVASGQELRRLVGHALVVNAVAFSPDGRLAVSAAGQDAATANEVILWDVASGEELRRYRGHTDNVTSVAFSPDGRTLLTGSRDTTAILWDVLNGAVVRQFIGHTDWVLDAALSPDGLRAVSISPDRSGTSELILWDVATGEIAWRQPHLTGQLRSVAFSPDGRMVLSSYCGFASLLDCLLDGGITIWDVETGQPEATLSGHTSDVQAVAYSPDGLRALSAAADGLVVILDVGSGKPIAGFNGHSELVLSAAFSPDGKMVLSTSGNVFSGVHDIVLWDAATGRELRRFEGHSDVVNDVTFSPDGTQALTASADTTLILWDVATGAPIRGFQGHTGEVTSVAFSPDGRTAASGSFDGTVILWDVASGEELRRFAGHTDSVTSVDFSSDGAFILSASWDGTLVLWRIDQVDDLLSWTYANRPVRELTCEERRDFQVTPLCEEGVYPTRTPFATRLPTATRSP